MHGLYSTPDDFEAKIRIMGHEEGGRLKPPFNGIRWDFCYAEDSPQDALWMIWPDFFDDSGDSLPKNLPLPVGVELSVRMTVLVDNMRAQVHRQRIKVGTQFFCHEGSKRVAEGQVTKITGLFYKRK